LGPLDRRFLAIASWYQALDGLYNAEARRVLADSRQRDAIEELRIAACGQLTKEKCDTLPLIDNIFRDNRPVEPSKRFILFRPPWAGLLPPFPYGLAAALSVGALIAIAVIFSRREAAARGPRSASRDAHDSDVVSGGQ
jgi:hypothetical protein